MAMIHHSQPNIRGYEDPADGHHRSTGLDVAVGDAVEANYNKLVRRGLTSSFLPTLAAGLAWLSRIFAILLTWIAGYGPPSHRPC